MHSLSQFPTLRFTLLSTVLCSSIALAQTIPGDPADFSLNADNVISTRNLPSDGPNNQQSSPTINVGNVSESNGTNRSRMNGVLVFDISSISGTVTVASLSVRFEGIYEDPSAASLTTADFNVDLYGVGFSNDPNGGFVTEGSTDSNPANNVTSYYNGPFDASETLLADNFATPASVVGQTLTITGSALVDYLNSNGSDLTYAFFRLNPDSGAQMFASQPYYSFASANSATVPELLVTVPEPVTAAALAGLLTFGLAIIRQRRK